MLKGPKHCLNLHDNTFIIFFITLGETELEMSLSVICEILGLFPNTLTVDANYFLCKSQNLPQPIQVQLSKKQLFLSFLPHFSNLH